MPFLANKHQIILLRIFSCPGIFGIISSGIFKGHFCFLLTRLADLVRCCYFFSLWLSDTTLIGKWIYLIFAISVDFSSSTLGFGTILSAAEMPFVFFFDLPIKLISRYIRWCGESLVFCQAWREFWNWFLARLTLAFLLNYSLFIFSNLVSIFPGNTIDTACEQMRLPPTIWIGTVPRYRSIMLSHAIYHQNNRRRNSAYLICTQWWPAASSCLSIHLGRLNSSHVVGQSRTNL